ncbi:hypothetical protein [Burkholderia pseudomallei]|uniref:hypothetical protein n=1 Tax=Burkholderia pseudomallei TaxID=28450 RepID=UPI0012AD55E7|nr:hypothetical protein [Burkholderia pseudomallei]
MFIYGLAPFRETARAAFQVNIAMAHLATVLEQSSTADDAISNIRYFQALSIGVTCPLG